MSPFFSTEVSVGILKRSPLYIRQWLVPHDRANSSTPRPALCRAARTAWPSGLGWAAEMPWPQEKCSQLFPYGGAPTQYPQSRHLHGLAFVEQHSKTFLCEHCFRAVYLYKKILQHLGRPEGENLCYGPCLHGILCVGRSPVTRYTGWGSQHLKGCKIIYAILFLEC